MAGSRVTSKESLSAIDFRNHDPSFLFVGRAVYRVPQLAGCQHPGPEWPPESSAFAQGFSVVTVRTRKSPSKLIMYSRLGLVSTVFLQGLDACGKASEQLVRHIALAITITDGDTIEGHTAQRRLICCKVPEVPYIGIKNLLSSVFKSSSIHFLP